MVSLCQNLNPANSTSTLDYRVTTEPKLQVDEFSTTSTSKYENRIRVIRDLTEIHEATWVNSDRVSIRVYVKYLRYATIMTRDLLVTDDNRRANNPIESQIQRWVTLNHPNIMPFIGYDLHDVPALVFSWYKNGNISQYSKAHPEADRCRLLRDICRGLSYLHSLEPNPIIHGSIKPTNVIVGDLGQAMLVDFGMAPDIRALERHITLQDPDWTSFRYMSPESIEEGVITTETDVYSFGLLALEVLSGNAPYHNLGHVAAMIKITEGSTPLPGDHPRIPYPSPAWDMMQRCWATDPSKRPVIEEVNVWIAEWHLEGPRS